MKKPAKILAITLSAVFVVALFTVVTGAMAVAGKIDLSGVPVIGAAIDGLKASSVVSGADGAVETAEEMYRVAAAATPSTAYTSITDVAVGEDGSLYAADETGMKLYRLDSSGKILATYAASAQVNGVCPGASEVYVLEGGLAGQVTVLNAADLSKKSVIEVGHTPTAMVLNGTTGYVADRFDNAVSVINLSTGEVTGTIEIDGREPDAMTVAGDKIFVACHLPDDGSTSEVISANVAVIDMTTNKVVKVMDLVNGAGGVKDICVSPDGKTVYVSHVIARYAYPTTQLDRGWINTNGFTIIDADSMTVKVSMMLDEVELGAANPWGITVSEDGAKLICAISGTDEVMVVDIAAMNQKIADVQNGTGVVDSVSKIPDYLPFLDGCRERISLSGKGARAVCTAGDSVYIGLYFDGNVDVLNLADNTVKTLSFVSQPENDEVRKGAILFADATQCYQQWESCLSCHPDALADGFNWDNLNDGLGNPKSAKSLLYSHRTPPVMSTGIRASAEIAVRAGMKYIQFNVLDETSMSYIDEYLKSLQPAQSPYLNRDGTLTESATRGKEIFESVGCAECHPAPLYTDMKLHASKLTDDTVSWENRDMDTPTLIEVWRTGPWGFDGRFSKMEDAVRYYASSKNLTDDQIADLTNFVMSIGDEGELYGVEQIFVTSDSGTTINGLVPGGTITQLSVRRQQEGAPASAKITATLKDAAGKEIKSVTKSVSGVAFNTAEKVALDSGIAIPSDLASGSTLTITITNDSGAKIATDLVITY
ncbi:MAG: c-type cytochrome [Candidatus Howiella sp.]|jgi:sugar lactone lactonase YvrE